MGSDSEYAESTQLYAAAYAAHHTKHDLVTAVKLYKRLIVSHPTTPEADLARTKIQGILDAVKNEMQEAQLELRIAQYERDASLNE